MASFGNKYKAKLTKKEEALSWWRERERENGCFFCGMRFFVQIRSAITKESGNWIETRQRDWEEEEEE